MADDALLSDLCSICNTTKSKYRCPGCAAQTCSLPCYKRHQQWAQCTGKRDPTKYVKKSQLATPAGIDHDFNFLTSVERGLEKAEKNVNDRGLGAASDLHEKPRQGEPSDSHFAAAGVKVIRAPKGLSRQKENKTHRSKKGKHIVWTVEWIREDKTRILTESSSAQTIAEAQPFYRVSKKRKRGAEVPPSIKNDSQDAAVTALGEIESPTIKADEESGLPPPRPSSQAKQDQQTGGPEVDTRCEEADHLGPDITRPNTESVPPEYHFFLLRPRTSSHRYVLIPITISATLAECLHGRTVLEYPTIYAFSNSTPPPSAEFMLEEEYIKQEGDGQGQFDDLLKSVNPDTLRSIKEEAGGEMTSEDVDSKKILDVLKQDLGAGV